MMRIEGAKAIPMKVRMTPQMTESVIAVCTVSETSFLDPEPKYLATITFTPTESPKKTFTSRFMSDEVEPIAASAFFPTNRPATIMSTALNKSCRMPDNISGMVKETIFGSRAPSVMFMLYFFSFMVTTFYREDN